MLAGSTLAHLHAWIAVVVAIVAALLVVLGTLQALGIVRGRIAKLWLDRLILGLLAAVAVASAVGLLVLVLVAPPREWLHLVYAALALAAAPLARYVGARRGSTRLGAWVAGGGLLTLAALLRLWGTGS
jgi:hypothetical protein